MFLYWERAGTLYSTVNVTDIHSCYRLKDILLQGYHATSLNTPICKYNSWVCIAACKICLTMLIFLAAPRCWVASNCVVMEAKALTIRHCIKVGFIEGWAPILWCKERTPICVNSVPDFSRSSTLQGDFLAGLAMKQATFVHTHYCSSNPLSILSTLQQNSQENLSSRMLAFALTKSRSLLDGCTPMQYRWVRS